jgi:hypothetical protein
MSKYRLRIPVEKINFYQWTKIFDALRVGNHFGYVIAENDEYFFTEEFNCDIMGLLAVVSKSPQYSVKDKYVLYDKHHSLILSGDEKLILSVLSIHFRTALTIFMKELDDGRLELSDGLEGVFEEYE